MKRNYRIVTLILVTFFVISFLTNILGALNPSVSKSFNLSETMAGFLPFSFFIAYGVMSIPAGFMLEKFGEKKLILFSFFLALLGSVLFASFPTFPVFIFTLFTIGTGMAVLQVVINPLLRVSGGEENYAFTSVLAQLIFGAASFISPQVYSWLVTNIDSVEKSKGWFINTISNYIPVEMSWVSIYWIFAIASLLMIFIVVTVAFPKVKLNDDEKVGTKDSYLDLFKNRMVILYFFGIFAYVGAEQGISYWMSKFLQVYHGYDYETIGATAVGNFWGLMTVGGVFGLVLLKIMDSKIVLRLFTSLAIASFAIALYGSSSTALYAFQASGLFLSVMYPIIVSLALNSVSKHHGSFAGILMTGIMGGAIVQLLIGFTSDLTSLKTGMLLVFVALAYILSISVWAKPIIKNKTISFKKTRNKMTTSNKIKIIGIDLGGTKVNIGLVQGDKILEKKNVKLPQNSKNQWDVINLIIDLIKEIVSNNKVSGIGIGVPSILDREKGIIHEVQNIPTWKEVHLADILNQEFGIPVFLDNDANCFALGEYHFGKGKKCKNLVGLTLGTGMGTGIITNYHLMSDANGGAGEFGMIPYLDGVFENYCSGQFFKRFFNSNGEELLQMAKQGNEKALEAFDHFGVHLGNAIKTIMYAIDPQKIIIGGSVVESSPYFNASLKKSINSFSYKKTLSNFEIIYSNTPNIAILGATSLYYDRTKQITNCNQINTKLQDLNV